MKSKLEEAREFFKEVAEVYGTSIDDVEEAFIEVMKDYFETENVLLDDEGLYVDGVLYDYFDGYEIRKFRERLEEKIHSLAIKKWQNYFEVFLTKQRVLRGVLQKEGEKNYYFTPLLDGKAKDLLIIQVPKHNVRLDFGIEKGNEFILYLPNKAEVFRKNKAKYFNKFFSPAKVITREAVKRIIAEKIIKAFSSIYSIDDFKVKYIFPIKNRYGIINLIIKKPISGNLLNYLDNAFKRYGYIVNIKEKK